jgi:hypothetical protein
MFMVRDRMLRRKRCGLVSFFCVEKSEDFYHSIMVAENG